MPLNKDDLKLIKEALDTVNDEKYDKLNKKVTLMIKFYDTSETTQKELVEIRNQIEELEK